MARITSPTDHLTWTKAQISMNTGACVELARLAPGIVALRDSKTAQRPLVSPAVRDMIDQARAGGFDGLLSSDD